VRRGTLEYRAPLAVGFETTLPEVRLVPDGQKAMVACIASGNVAAADSPGGSSTGKATRRALEVDRERGARRVAGAARRVRRRALVRDRGQAAVRRATLALRRELRARGGARVGLHRHFGGPRRAVRGRFQALRAENRARELVRELTRYALRCVRELATSTRKSAQKQSLERLADSLRRPRGPDSARGAPVPFVFSACGCKLEDYRCAIECLSGGPFRDDEPHE
jgi:hypothetical protein